jgi:hypothetical protein
MQTNQVVADHVLDCDDLEVLTVSLSLREQKAGDLVKATDPSESSSPKVLH